LSPRSRALSKGKGHGAEEFVESRLRHLGFPTFGEEEIVGEEAEGSMTLEIGYPGLGEDTTESSAPLVADIVGLVGKEMSLGPGKVTVFLSSWNASQASNLVSFVKNEKHIAAWLRDNSWAQVLHLARDDTVIVRHKAVLVRVWTNLGLLHEHKNRLTGQLARLLLRGLVSHWTGEMLVCVFAHDGSRRIWRAPVQHSDKFGAVNIVPIPRSPRDNK